MNRDEILAAHRAGRAATPGDGNPYAGQGVLADMWRLGYKQMLLDRLNRSPARQAFLADDGDE
ncbi:hypothetical protein SEA_JULIETTE_12 [Mycobacterium phage Juliette]|uniref:Uncharacterized protein n=1 Tax=Mycobacterium phage Eponine TaxID=2708631 RepID=A0A6G6XSR0_9CAUD|nr:hypothetical protein I5G69_gp12 [Mycobacterium phage Eponine]QIG61791.1 hypothetical protein SEA_EPONINE_12 [Mycobacterium phage Eponine]QTF81619.1 hypothetical protein SEA_JULIETTE_12 [Mycobacterium phage Juliette]USH45290.1 hypothetical protein SEA_RUTHIEJR_11 [Mycobacterium phage Ruthiejr]